MIRFGVALLVLMVPLTPLTPLAAVTRAAADTLDVAITADIDAPLRATSRLFATRKQMVVRVLPHVEGRIVSELLGKRADDPDVVVASEAAIERLAASGAIAPATIARLFETEVVLIGAADGVPRFLESFHDIELPSDPEAAAASIAIPDSTDLTYGIARRLLERARVWRELRPHTLVVTDARAALGAVVSGAAAFAFVPEAAARNSKEVRVVWRSDDPSTARITYALALFVRSQRRPEAAELHKFLTSPTAGRLYESHGFTLAR